MKNILITGANSYIGTCIETHLQKWPDKYKVDTLDMVNDLWRNSDFSRYDVVFHVAGIAHSDTGHATDERKALYYKINTELAVETAQKAKMQGVKQFIFMSSMIVYGDSAPIGKKKIITKDTIPEPANFYGDSKLQAEIGIRNLESVDFRVVVLRPPMIYGKGSKGNYPLLSKVAKKIPLFPSIKNERSMLYVNNLSEFVRLMIENEEHGIFFPQNSSFTQTRKMVQEIALTNRKRICVTPIFNWMLYLIAHCPGKLGKTVNKVFGNLVYDQNLSKYCNNSYQSIDFAESIRLTEEM